MDDNQFCYCPSQILFTALATVSAGNDSLYTLTSLESCL